MAVRVKSLSKFAKDLKNTVKSVSLWTIFPNMSVFGKFWSILLKIWKMLSNLAKNFHTEIKGINFTNF